MNEYEERCGAEFLFTRAEIWAKEFSEEHDRDASVVALLVRAIEVATGRTVNMETMYDIRND